MNTDFAVRATAPLRHRDPAALPRTTWDAPAERGFCAADRWQFNQTQVVRAVRC